MEKWFTTPQFLPEPNQLCWVRLNYWFGAPFQANWIDAEHGWHYAEHEIDYPIWTISRWRPV